MPRCGTCKRPACRRERIRAVTNPSRNTPYAVTLSYLAYQAHQGTNAQSNRSSHRGLLQGHTHSEEKILVFFSPGGYLIRGGIILTHNRFSCDDHDIPCTKIKKEGHPAVLPDMRLAVTFALRRTVNEQRLLRFIPQKTDRERVW